MGTVHLIDTDNQSDCNKLRWLVDETYTKWFIDKNQVRDQEATIRKYIKERCQGEVVIDITNKAYGRNSTPVEFYFERRSDLTLFRCWFGHGSMTEPRYDDVPMFDTTGWDRNKFLLKTV